MRRRGRVGGREGMRVLCEGMRVLCEGFLEGNGELEVRKGGHECYVRDSWREQGVGGEESLT